MMSHAAHVRISVYVLQLPVDNGQPHGCTMHSQNGSSTEQEIK